MTPDEQFVKERFPDAFSTFDDYWGEYLIVIAQTRTEAEAWATAAERIRREDKYE